MTKSIIFFAQSKPDHLVVLKVDCPYTVTEIEDHAFSVMKPLQLVGDQTEFSQTGF